MTQVTDAEQVLLEMFQQQKQMYQTIMPVAEQAGQLLDSGQVAHAELELIGKTMVEIQVVDEKIRVVALEVEATGKTNPNLKHAKDELTTVIQALIGLTGQLESKIKQARDGLQPALSQHVVASKMHRAYIKK